MYVCRLKFSHFNVRLLVYGLQCRQRKNKLLNRQPFIPLCPFLHPYHRVLPRSNLLPALSSTSAPFSHHPDFVPLPTLLFTALHSTSTQTLHHTFLFTSIFLHILSYSIPHSSSSRHHPPYTLSTLYTVPLHFHIL